MKRTVFLLAMVTGLILGSASTADARGGRWGQDLLPVAQTNIPNFDGGTYSLCHLVDFLEILFIPAYTSVESYALSADGCEGDDYLALSAAMMAQGQAEGHLPADLPAEPRLSPKHLLFGHAWVIFAVLAALFKGLAWWFHERPKRGKTRSGSDALAVNALAAMGHVAISDGHIHEKEVTQIAGILTRLTGRGYDRGRVRLLLQQIQMHGNDVHQIGHGLNEKERRIVMEAALHIAVADGHIDPAEYQLVSQIASRLQISGDDFRAALGRISSVLSGNAGHA